MSDNTTYIILPIVSSNLIHGEVHSIQHYVIKFASYLRQVGGFIQVLQDSSTNKTDRHDIAEILLKVALNTINLTKSSNYQFILNNKNVRKTYQFDVYRQNSKCP